ncbi:MAG: NADH-quinone oxidoreductase subunit L [Bacteroidia bacterium]|nr:NADH-quinone oxidoreductase subunit L [Bacteroidia bacterium]
MNYANYIYLIPLLPLLSFLLLGFFGRKYVGAASGWVGVLSLGTSALLSVYTAFRYFFVDGLMDGKYQTIIPVKIEWLRFSETLSIDMGILLDPVSVMMLVVVTFVSLMVHLFSIGYMKGEERYATYFSYLSLFTFSMLGLVLSTNIFQIYMFWELVGVSSYLLIGYYFTKPSAVKASKKAFIVTRFADLGFLIGILILGFSGGSFDFATLIATLTNTQSPELTTMISSSFLGITLLSWALTLVFIGGAGKSAMFPLHIWLPDAMEGPTPVSALIHAATMVVAGVYLVARMFPVFALDPAVMQLITITGITSAVLAAIIACTQTDIKRVLAYSTMSQIGYMMFAMGISGYAFNDTGYTGSLFHLFTHAFFKSLLFLGAGAVIHYVHSNEMKDMGGLRKTMPITHITFLLACLAIAGIPPLAGFFSKEEILLAAWESNKTVYFMALGTSALTAFYMFRLYFSIFWSKEAAHHDNHHGEGTFTMKLPLLLLAGCTIGAGLIPFSNFVTSNNIPEKMELHLLFSIAPVLLAVLAIGIAAILYKNENDKPDKIASSMNALYRTALNKFYIDEIYLFITKKIIFNLIAKPAAWIDRNIVDGLMNLLGNATIIVSDEAKSVQSGKVQWYALAFLGGILILTVAFIYLY